MITAHKSEWFERVFAVYNRNLIKRRFTGLRVAGLHHLKTAKHNGGVPLVLYVNHSSWWDGLVIYQIGRHSRLDQYAMMEERQLREYPFHRLGAFSVVRENAREALRSIEYAATLLRTTTGALWIFPQGATLPNDTRPLKLYTGAARIIKRIGVVDAAPIAIRYEFLNDFRPEILVRVGTPKRIKVDATFDVKRLTNCFATTLAETLDALRDDVLANEFTDYTEIVAPGRRFGEVAMAENEGT